MSALKSRWVDINREVGRFSGCMLNESGKTSDDMFKDALTMYEAQHGEQFVFHAAYNVLSTKEKWKHTNTKKRHADGMRDSVRDGEREGATQRPAGAKATTLAIAEAKFRRVQLSTSQSIANSLVRKNDILIEMACIELFNMPDVDPLERKQFFSALRQKKLAEFMSKDSNADLFMTQDNMQEYSAGSVESAPFETKEAED
ncbi:hypothetical protein AC1031_009613 [Aphanomyces cochlioides]|nr:hypothetical protein AC1031_009613 [Aphanomyces cochlioides]